MNDDCFLDLHHELILDVEFIGTIQGPKGEKGDRGPQGLPAESTVPGELVLRYIGDGSSKVYEVIHNLNTMHPFVQVQDISGTTPVYMETAIRVKDKDSLTVEFTSAPKTNSVCVMVSSGLGVNATIQVEKYLHVQDKASTEWVINHNLGVPTSFTVMGTDGTVIETAETIVSDNVTKEHFTTATAGRAIER